MKFVFSGFRLIDTEAATGSVLSEKVFLEITQNSQETPVPSSLF